MARTESTMLELGTPAPDFRLPDVVSGKTVSLSELVQDGQPLLVMFLSRHCPYVQHVKQGIAALARDYRDRGVAIVAVSSNFVPEYPDDAPERLREMATELGFEFPICYDESQDVAKAYHAACTPEFYLFDGERRLVYRGQMDGSRKFNDVPVTGVDLRAALDAVLSGRSVSAEQRPSLGCNIKWRPGNEPEYYR